MGNFNPCLRSAPTADLARNGAFTHWNPRARTRYYDGMELDGIISEICDEADDFLAGVTRRDEAKAGIDELLTMRHGTLPLTDRKIVIDQAMGILEREGFFERDAGGET